MLVQKVTSLLFFLVLMASITRAAVIEVCSGCQTKTIKAAVESAGIADTILVKKGTYRENNIVITRPLTLLGEGNPIVDGKADGDILIIQSDNVVVKGMKLQNVKASFINDHAAIRVEESKNCVIEDNELYDTFFGIYLQMAGKCIIRNNRVIGLPGHEVEPGNAIHLWKCDSIQVVCNLVTGHRDGIYFEFVDNSEIIGNISRNNERYGLHFMFSNHDVYRENIFEANGAGVAVMFSDYIKMIRNNFRNNWGGAAYGILLKEISQCEMLHNSFTGNTKGIYAEGTNNIIIRNNDFVSNGWALDIKGNSIDNEIIQNNFIANTFDVVTNSQRNPNKYLHNYWSKHPAYDLNDDGYADQPYRPVSLFSMIIARIPATSMLLHSTLARLFDYAEKVFPGLTPEALKDPEPLMKPSENDIPATSRQTIQECESAGSSQRPL